MRNVRTAEYADHTGEIGANYLVAWVPLVVCATELIARASDKPDYSAICHIELFELERVETKEEQDVAAAYLCLRLRAVWLCVSARIELVE